MHWDGFPHLGLVWMGTADELSATLQLQDNSVPQLHIFTKSPTHYCSTQHYITETQYILQHNSMGAHEEGGKVYTNTDDEIPTGH